MARPLRPQTTRKNKITNGRRELHFHRAKAFNFGSGLWRRGEIASFCPATRISPGQGLDFYSKQAEVMVIPPT